MTGLPVSVATIAFLAAVFLAAAVFAYGIGTLVAPKPAVQRRLEAIGDATPAPPAQSWFARAMASLARVSTPTTQEELTPTRLRLYRAGWRQPNAPAVFYGFKTLLTLAFPAALMLYTGLVNPADWSVWQLLLLLGLAVLGYYTPNLVLNSVIRDRQSQLFFAFPDALDVMRICVEAGLSLDASIQRVARDIHVESPALADELQMVALELRAGASRRQALLNLAARVQLEDVDALVSMLVQADRFGTSIADALRVHSSALRTRRRLMAEERAAKLPVKLLVPLIFCIFPSLLLVLLGPTAISVYRVLLPTITGR
ncbi:MAG TPA: type II secretion system F family protein [Usitatibacter sp.]|nr:type II secretion system F family protein [Usitatibacter sp.]